MTDFLSQDINDYCFIDTETLSGANLKETGIYPYTADPSFRVMIVTYAIGDGEPQIWKQERAHVGDVLCFDDAPQDLIDFAARVAAGKAWFVAWNAAFDRLALSRGLDGLEWLMPDHFLDAMAQGVRSHLPPDLAGAAKTVKAEVQKRPDGKRLIQQFCVPPFADPAEHPDEWEAFCLYALDDIPSMRAVWQATMPLSRMEWEQYWASERVNDRGMPVDRAFVEAASALAEENAIRASADISRLTGGAIRTVNQHEALCAWVLDRVDHLSEAKAILLREVVEEQEEEGDGVVRLEKHSLERSRVEDLIAYLARLDEEQGLTDDEWQVYQVLQVRAYGASATPRKFTKALPMLTDDDRLCGQYVFNGAAATGRFCVAADTEVLTPAGYRAILSLSPGDVVVSGAGLVRLVTALVYKGRETLYRVTGPDGEMITCTAAHRVATFDGWRRIDECFKISPSGRGPLREGCAIVSITDDAHGKDCGGRGANLRHGCVDPSHLYLGRRPQDIAWSLSFDEQSRTKESDVRRKDGGGADHARWSSGGLERVGIHIRAPDHCGPDAGGGIAPAACGGSPHRRKQAEQRPGQLSDMHEARAPVHAQGPGWEVVEVGEGDVWDISVDGDSSYVAGRLIHHNSSRGLQIHNLTRSTVGGQVQELAIIDQVQDRVPFNVFAEHGPVGRTLSRLIRPMFVAPDGMKMVWADYSAIEARVLPWLGEAFGGGSVLDIFRANDADPSLPDIYKRQAGSILGKDAKDVTKSERQSHGKVPCIAAGQPVLTDRGLVPIEDVTVDMRVWDGVKFVSHQGSVLKGVKDVWEYQGLVATADHIVWTEEIGPCEFLIAARRGYNLVKSGHGRCPVRVGGDHRSRDSVHARKMAWCLRKDALHRVRSSVVAGKVELIAGAIEGMPSLFAPAPDTQVAGPQVNGGEASLHESEQPAVEWVWGARNRVSVCVCSGGGSVHTGKSWLGPSCGDRPNRQQRALRSGEPALGHACTTELEQAYKRPADVGVSAGRMALRKKYGEAETAGGADACRDTGGRRARRYHQTEGLARYRGKARVYDIVNAGPRHRFTVSGALVHNCLSLGFGGGKGALFNMARAYGASFTDAEAGDIVNKWRAVNPWARAYWDDTWEAAIWCMHNPGTPRAVGSRLTYVYLPEYMGGTLICLLPDGRPLLYPAIKWEKRERKDKMTGKIEVKEQLTYRRGYGRAALWAGTLTENATQAVAASLLRHVIWRLDREWPQLVVGHVHDEVVALAALQDVAAGREALRRAMLDLPAWAEGLPIACEASESFYYTKTVD